MEGFVEFLADVVIAAGIDESSVFRKQAIELPGFFRPTKEWDLVVVQNGVLVAAMDAKSQAGPSLSDKFNDVTGDALGSAIDFWTAFREGAYLHSPQPFLGYFFMMEDSSSSNAPLALQEPHFHVFPEFIGASTVKRYDLFCRKLVLERHYTASAFITSCCDTGLAGTYSTPSVDLSPERFARALKGQIASFL